MTKTTLYNWLTLKKAVVIIALIVSAFLLFIPHHAKAYGFNWNLSSFNTDINVREDGSIAVKETIVADFTNEDHHGIYRTIPIRYRDKFGQSFKLRFNLISITDGNGNDWWYERSNSGDYVYLRIGDPDRTFNDERTYEIMYEVNRAISFHFDDHDELYWNATGDEWEIPINEASATITLPDSMDTDNIKSTCFTGGYGSTYQDCVTEVSGTMISYATTGPLNAYEGLTIAASFPKGVIVPPTAWQQFIWTLSDNWGYLIPFLTFVILYYLWWTRGRDPQTNRDTVMPIYTPPENLTPSEAGTLIDEKADMHDLSATIIDMAVRGYLKIKETKTKKWVFEDTDYTFELLKKDYQQDKTLQEHEIETLKAVFGSDTSKKLSALKNVFYKDIPGIKTAIYQRLIDKKFFPRSPEKVRESYLGTGIFITFSAFFGFAFFLDWSIAIPIGIGLSGIVIMLFAKYMPAKTKKGVEMYYKVLGLEMFIDTAEKDRIKWQENENMFEQLLPYAMAFKIADKWSKTFKDLYKDMPKWYESNDPNFVNNFNTGYLIGRLNSFSNSMHTTFTSAPRSSGSGGSWSGGSGFGGGGFSGGGFGGGGGGGW